ncbi:hypothetical protein PMAYCL1PPCAC_20824, partial [Pristionchus mayeri]
KRRSESVEMRDKDNEHSAGSDTEKRELKCPECDHRSRTVDGWEKHLRSKHSTTPALAGCLLRCDCGHESYSRVHSKKCYISNFTLIRKG